MKLTAILLTACILQASAKGYTQKVTFSGTDVPLEKVFSVIEKQTGYVVFYNYSAIKDAKAITVKANETPLEKFLNECFKEQPFKYVIEGKTILVTRKETVAPTAVLTPAVELPPPPIDVRGRVVNEAGEPLAGASVQVKGDKTKGTITDANGYFEIKGIDENATLSFTSVNMVPFEIKVAGKTEFSISLVTKITALGDVQVTVNTGYQQIPKERATGSFTKIDNELLNRKVSSDIISRLENVTSGFLIYQNQLSVRGRSTIFANQDPLIVVDNFPYYGDINTINPNDIESVTFLKDAAAASIWGAYSGNGVIVITTKKGKFNQPIKVGINSNITIGQKPDLFYSPNFLNSSDFIDVEQFLFSQGYYDNALTNTATYPAVSPVVNILAKQRAGTITQGDATAQINALRNFDIRNDLTKSFYQQSVAQQYSLNVSAGTNKSYYYFSAGFDNIQTNLVGNDNKRFTLNSQATFNPLKNLEITGGINFIQANSNTDNTLNDVVSSIASGHVIYPYAQLADANGVPLSLSKDYSEQFIQSMQSAGLLNWQFFPLKELGLSSNTTKSFTTRLNAGVKYNIIKGLSAEVKYQYLRGITTNEVLYDQNSFYTRNMINRFTVINSNNTLTRNIPFGGIFQNSNADLISHSGRAQISFNRNFRMHEIIVIAGHDIQESKTNFIRNGVYGYDVNTSTYAPVNYNTFYPVLPLGNGAIPSLATIRGTLNRFRSFFGNAAYTYNNRYTYSLSGRIDQSNLFGYKTNNRSVPLWSTGVKWDISKESFYKINSIPSLSIRITYGYNGNLDKSATPLTLVSYSQIPNGLAQNNFAAILQSGNPELTWEKIGMLNIGTDFSLKREIVTGSLEYFIKRGKNMIGDDPLDPTTGFSSIRGNYSDMSGRGFDVVLNTKNLTGIIRWKTTILFSHVKDKVTKYKGSSARTLILEGKPVQSVYSYRWGGLDPATGDPRGYLADTLSINYTLLNLTLAKDKVYSGPGTPTYFGSILNTIGYQNFELSMNISYRGGYVFRRSSIIYSSLFGEWAGHKDFVNRWQKPGDELITNVPSMIYPGNSARDAFYINSEALLEKGANIKLEDVRISYQAKSQNSKMKFINNIQFYVYANNLGIIWKANKNGIDPNYINGYLPPKTVSFGIQANF